jgi:hypothetical protein
MMGRLQVRAIHGLEPLAQGRIEGGVIVVAPQIEEAFREAHPGGFIRAMAGKALDAVQKTGAEGRVVHRAPRDAEDRPARRQPAVAVEVEEGGGQLAPDQVAAGAEENEGDGRVRDGWFHPEPPGSGFARHDTSESGAWRCGQAAFFTEGDRGRRPYALNGLEEWGSPSASWSRRSRGAFLQVSPSHRLAPNGFAALWESRPLVVSTGWPLRKDTRGNLWKIRL